MVKTGIKAVDYYVPERVVTNDDLSKIVDTNDEWIATRTGIKNRHISTGQNTSELCIEVGKKLLAKSGTDPKDIDLIIAATITPDFATPNTACIIQGALGCENAWAFDLSAACSGFVYALGVADKFIQSGRYKKALVFGGETLSKIVDWSDRATCVLFGDGAGGALVEATEDGGIIDEDMHSKGEDGMKLPGGERKVRNFLSNPDEPDRTYLEMDGRAIFTFATKTVPKSVGILLERNGLTVDDIKYIVPHQANSRIIDIVAKKLNAPMDKFFMDVDKFGNTSAASIPIALGHMDEKGLLNKGDYIIITGFGGGLTWGSMLIKW